MGPTVRHFAGHRGARLALYDYSGGIRSGVAVLFCHGNGFNARSLEPVIRRVAAGASCFAYDQRGHGHSETHSPPYPWRGLAEDVAAAHGEIAPGFDCVIGVGHSMGGYGLTLAALDHPRMFRHIVLIDPVIGPPEFYREDPFFGSEHFAAKRKATWASPAQMFASLRSKGGYKLWTEESMRLYCEHGLRRRDGPDADGAEPFELCCPPWVEAHNYEQGCRPEARIHDRLPELQVPATLLRARSMMEAPLEHGRLDMSTSPTDPQLASLLHGCDERYLPELSHFMPMQEPQLVADIVNAVVAEVGVSRSRL